ncbi:2766_t:CDS:1, partial [Scutellospora calospora]
TDNSEKNNIDSNENTGDFEEDKNVSIQVSENNIDEFIVEEKN